MLKLASGWASERMPGQIFASKRSLLSAFFRRAAFNAPRKGDRVELPNRPGEYFLVTGNPDVRKDAAGNTFWRVEALDPEGRSTTLNSDSVQSWQHFRGPNNEMHEGMLARQRDKENAAKLPAFEAKHRFPDGQPIQKSMTLKVKPGAPGDILGVFAGEDLRVTGIDPDGGHVSFAPVDPALGEYESQLASVPAADVLKWMEPVRAGRVKPAPAPGGEGAPAERPPRPEVHAEFDDDVLKKTWKLRDGKTVTVRDLLSLMPTFVSYVKAGRVNSVVNVYTNYGGGKGEERFFQDMARYGFSPDDTDYRLNNAKQTYDEKGHRHNLRGPWQATLHIQDPVPDELVRELTMFGADVKQERDGIAVHRSELYRLMQVIKGLEEKGAQKAASRRGTMQKLASGWNDPRLPGQIFASKRDILVRLAEEGWPESEDLKEGSFEAWCKREGFEGACEECGEKGLKSKNKHIRGKAAFYMNTVVKKKHEKHKKEAAVHKTKRNYEHDHEGDYEDRSDPRGKTPSKCEDCGKGKGECFCLPDESDEYENLPPRRPKEAASKIRYEDPRKTDKRVKLPLKSENKCPECGEPGTRCECHNTAKCGRCKQRMYGGDPHKRCDCSPEDD